MARGGNRKTQLDAAQKRKCQGFPKAAKRGRSSSTKIWDFRFSTFLLSAVFGFAGQILRLVSRNGE